MVPWVITIELIGDAMETRGNEFWVWSDKHKRWRKISGYWRWSVWPP